MYSCEVKIDVYHGLYKVYERRSVVGECFHPSMCVSLVWTRRLGTKYCWRSPVSIAIATNTSIRRGYPWASLMPSFPIPSNSTSIPTVPLRGATGCAPSRT